MAVSPGLQAAADARRRRHRRVGRLHQRRHDRVPGGRARPLLLPRDEHPSPGGAPDHRARHRRGPGAPGRSGSRAANGSTLPPREAVSPRGHAIECRVYAEDPDAGFLPSPGRVLGLRAPDGPGVRDDSGVEAGAEISIYYDPLVSKLIVWGRTRDEAIARMLRALGEYEVSGIRTSLPFFRWMLREPAFARGEFHTGYLDELLQSRRGDPFDPPDVSSVEVAAVALALARRRPAPSLTRRTRLQARRRAAVPGAPIRRGGWKVAARREGLRA